MAFPSSPCGVATPATVLSPNVQTGHPITPVAVPTRGSSQTVLHGEHQLEKLEFALAVALTRGDLQRSEQLRHQIDALGGNREEPGT